MSRFLDAGNMIQHAKRSSKSTSHGKIESTDYAWRWSALKQEMTVFTVNTVCVPRSLEPMADTRVALPDMNTRHARMVTRKASARPDLGNVIGKR